MKIIDITTFFSEWEILKIRLYELQDIVDYFIILEMNQTHLGDKKSSVFLKKWNEIKKSIKIKNRLKIYYYLHNFPDTIQSNDNWGREFYQRNHLADCLLDLDLSDNDLIMMSDCDEIASKNSVVEAFSKSNTYDIFGIPIYYQPFFLNVRTGPPTVGVRCFKYKILKEKSLQDIRHILDLNLNKTENTGWHLTFQGGPEQIVLKSKSFVHGFDYIESFGCCAKDITVEKQAEELNFLLKNGFHEISNHSWIFMNSIYPNVPKLVEKEIEYYKSINMIATKS